MYKRGSRLHPPLPHYCLENNVHKYIADAWL